MILAPLRGVTIRAFREVFATQIREAGFTSAYAPFIPANPGIRVTERLLAEIGRAEMCDLPLVPQVITKDPASMAILLEAFKAQGFARADLNAGCPFPMIVRRGRGSGLMRTPDLLERLVETGVRIMGAGNFSVKMRLGIERPDEILALMPRLNRYPLTCVVIHARTTRDMYAGPVDHAAFSAAAQMSTNPIVYNGDADVTSSSDSPFETMVGRAFIRGLGRHPDCHGLLRRYIARSRAELSGDTPVLGRVKELLSYWCDGDLRWHRLWPIVKICRTISELESLLPITP